MNQANSSTERLFRWILPVVLAASFAIAGSISLVLADGSDTGGGGGGGGYGDGFTVNYPNGASVTGVDTPLGGGWVGEIGSCGGSCYGSAGTGDTVMYSNYWSSLAGTDVWIGSSPSYSSGSDSGSGGGGPSGGGSGPGGNTDSGPGSGPGGGGHWEQQCTSSGKGGQSCQWVWVANPAASEEGPCLTQICSDATEFEGDDDGASTNNRPEFEVWIDAVPRLVRTGGSSTLEWGSTDAESCIVTLSSETVFTGTSGQQLIENITEQRTYVLQCTMQAGNILTSSVTISIIPVWREF